MQKRKLVSLLGMHLRDVNAKLAWATPEFMTMMEELPEGSEERDDYGFRLYVRNYYSYNLHLDHNLSFYFDNQLNCFVYHRNYTEGNYIPLDKATCVVSSEGSDIIVNKDTIDNEHFFYTLDNRCIKLENFYGQLHLYHVYKCGNYFNYPDYDFYHVLGKEYYLIKVEDSMEVYYHGVIQYVPKEWFVQYPEYFKICEECGRQLFSFNGDFVCACENVPFYSYHSSCIPDFKFYKVEGEEPKGYFGAEIEFIYPGDSEYTEQEYLNALRPISKYIHCSHDSSLNGKTIYRNGNSIYGCSQGIEIVFHPMTWRFWLSQYHTIKKVFDKLRSMGAASHDTDCCGLHIHASRTLFDSSEAQTYPILLVNGFKHSFEKFSRRPSSTYCGYTFNDMLIQKDFSYTATTSNLLSASRYSNGHHIALNYGVHSHNDNTDTVEFRIFKGTLNVDTLLSSIELVKNVIEISNKADRGELGCVRFSDLIYGRFVPNYIKDRIKHFDSCDDYYNDTRVSFGFLHREYLCRTISKIRPYLHSYDHLVNLYKFYFNDYPEQKQLVNNLKDGLILLKKFNFKFNLLDDDTIKNEYEASKKYYDAVELLHDRFGITNDDAVHDEFKIAIENDIEFMKEFNLHDESLAKIANNILRKRGR